MDCVNHSGTNATAYCQNCGKALCASCVRGAPGGQVLCEPCAVAWQSMQQPFVGPPVGGPNPAAAAVLGLIPGVGAMYNGQFFKGLIHVVIFAVLVSISSHFPIFGIFIAAWVLYQAFEAYHTAIARRDGMPPPDPLGLNEVGNWLNLGGAMHPPYPGQPPPGQAGPGQAGPGFAGPGFPGPGFTGPGGAPPPNAGPYQTPYAGQYQAPGQYQAGYTPVAGYTDPAVPPAPPVPPVYWRRREPIGALVLVGFGLLLLLNQIGWVTHAVLRFVFPLALIGFGAWLIIRRIGDTKGGGQ